MTDDDVTPEDAASHAAKKARIKVARDRMMEGKTGEKGLVIVHTGPGKGKSSSAFGMILRCIAHGMPCAVVQFIKGAMTTGERELLVGHFGHLCKFHTMGEGFTWETQDLARDKAAARAGWEKAKELIRDPENRMVLLDEINIALRYDYLDLAEVVAIGDGANDRAMLARAGLGVAYRAKPALRAAADATIDHGGLDHALAFLA